ncbi:MAG: isochorismatase family cysteine hydrolase [Kyrpidia sp.]|nr:isochorismatase family cysteine hydrolase [Kyrpidia sp.]
MKGRVAMREALLLVDLSKDFIDLDGALNCGRAGQEILPYVREVIADFRRAGRPILDIRDDHTEADFEIRAGLFPPHCLTGTAGRDLEDSLATSVKGYEGYLTWPKKTYDATYETPLLDYLDRERISRVHVLGVCTDICVVSTCLGLYKHRVTKRDDLDIVVHRRGVASFNSRAHGMALEHMDRVLKCTLV